MKKSLILFAGLVSLCFAAQSQNVTVQSAAGQNIENFLMQNFVGQGVYIYNATFNGFSGSVRAQYPQIGTFAANGYDRLSMESGIIMTTGHVKTAEGPNNSTSSSNPMGMSNSQYVDPQMAQMGITDNAYECSTLDFDFVCLNSNVSFTYCFGSEEYNEYVFSNYNDVFVFFLTGPDPATGQVVTRNIAMIPGTQDDDHPYGIPVAINTVNAGYSTGSYTPNCDGCYTQFYQYYQNNDTLNDYGSTANPGVQYDGLTSKLTASAAIVPCQSYHMHISVCDVSDAGFHSGVFLEGRSFTTTTAGIGLTNATRETVRKGTPRTISVDLGESSFDSAIVFVNFEGEAVSGVDFLCLTDDGVVLNPGDQFSVGSQPRTLSLRVLSGARPLPKDLNICFQTALCTDYPGLRVNDTMHFALDEAPNEGIEAAEQATLTLSPNPASERLTVSAPMAIGQVVVVDMAGRVACTVDAAGSQSVSVDVRHLAAGTYMVHAFTDAGTLSRRLVIE